MTRNRLLIAFFAILLGGVAVCAQKPVAQPNPRPAAPQTGGPIPEGKMALIYSEDFRDAKTGIARYNAIMIGLTNEFQPRQTALNQTAQRIRQLEEELTKLQASLAVDQNSLRVKAEQLDQMKKDYQRAGEDAQAAYKKKHDEVMLPLNADISRALEAYAKARGITVIIDGNQVPLVYAADNMDITKAFISEFNLKNPVTASATPRP